MSEAPSTEARVAELLRLAKSEGLSLQAIIVGDVRLVLSEPWPKSKQSVATAQAETVHEDESEVTPELRALRRWGLQQFGRRMKDDFLLQMRGVAT